MSNGACRAFFLLFLSLAFVAAPQPAYAKKQPGEYRTFTLYFENDVFEGTDRQYTNGVKLTLISPDLSGYADDPRIPKWSHSIVERLPFVGRPDTIKNISLSIGQNIYTPETISVAELMPDDRPYAGVTYAGIGFSCKDTSRMDTLEVTLGIVGPDSYAEQIQKTIHEWVGSPRPLGWHNQLKNEPVLNLYYERKWRFKQLATGRGWGADFIPHLGGAAGNAYTGLNLGGQVRFGWRLPNDFGTFVIRSGSDTNAPLDENDPRLYEPFNRFGMHLFAGIDGRCVLRNILLDGNTFTDSHSVSKNPFVANFVLGAGIIIYRFKISYARVFQTEEFYSQKEEQSYGSITLSFSY
ncbi:MAG: lipid A deacylase LpxR family protein [Desulfatibacillaceae bacterium]|nr:lipid A deacylase LpxR family protein [Desulfatibacillaceae bacterium]